MAIRALAEVRAVLTLQGIVFFSPLENNASRNARARKGDCSTRYVPDPRSEHFGESAPDFCTQSDAKKLSINDVQPVQRENGLPNKHRIKNDGKMTDPDQYAPDPCPWWRNKETVQKIGYILSALWMGGIVIATNGDTKHFLFNFIFTVPLVGWIIGLGIAAFLRRSRKVNSHSD